MASNIKPDYEVKLLMKSSEVLGPNNELENTLLSAFSANASAKKMNFQFLDTPTKDIYNKGWILRIRKTENDEDFELKFKKRYPICDEKSGNIKANIDAALTKARNDGFDSTSDYEAQIELGYQKQTLSISYEKPYKDKDSSNMELPLKDASCEMLNNNAPMEFKDWSDKGWGTEKLAASRVYGPVFATRSKGKWNGVKPHIEVWPVKGKASVGMEHIVEVSFKVSSLTEALEKRDNLVAVLQSNNWLLPEDFSRTSLVLERY